MIIKRHTHRTTKHARRISINRRAAMAVHGIVARNRRHDAKVFGK
jgi:hypothetical protein